VINIDVIKQRLSELGIDAQEFHTRAGISLDILDNESALATISAEVLVRICEVLDIDLAELLGRQRPARPASPDDDDLVIEAALARHGPLTSGDLATALSWPLRRVDHALHALSLRLLGTALHLVRTGDRVHLAPRAGLLNAETETRLHAAEQAHIPLSTQEAAVVLRLLAHRHGPTQQALLLDAETIDVLLYRGLAVQDGADLQPHADLSFAVALRAQPHLPGRQRAKPSGQPVYRSPS
jgi:transcriptional regulator with XRE-family HTH domain